MSTGSQWGLDFSEVARKGTSAVPTRIPGRVIHIDGDFISYHSTLPDEDCNLRPVEDCIEQFIVECDTLRALAGAERMLIHFTHPDSTKGGRYEQAIQQPYQDNRVKVYDDPDEEAFEKAQKALVHAVRLGMVRLYPEWRRWNDIEIKAQASIDYEADDTMSWAMNADPDNSVIWSGDKDLNMVPGLHLVDKTYELRRVAGFGCCYLDESGSATKVRGYGTSFFWHQLLMGDTADNIRGLKEISSQDLNEFFPSKACIEGLERLAAGRKLTKAQTEALNRAPQPCGPTKAHALLLGITNDYDALKRVSDLYKNTYADDWQRIILSEARMLWMTRYRGDSADQFIHEVVERGKPDVSN